MTVGPEQGLTLGKLCKCCEQVLCRCSNVCTYLVILSPDVVFFAHEDLLTTTNTLTLDSFVWNGEDFWMIFPFQFIWNSGSLLNSKVRVFDYDVEGSLTKVLTEVQIQFDLVQTMTLAYGWICYFSMDPTQFKD